MSSQNKKGPQKPKQSRYLFSEEIRHIRARGYGFVLLSVLLVLVMFEISHYTYSGSAEKYFEQQAYDTMTEVSVQISRSASIRIEHWYEHLYSSQQLALAYDASSGSYRALLNDMEKLNRSVFVNSGVVTRDGYLQLAKGARYGFRTEPFIKALTSGQASGMLACTINSDMYYYFNDKILLAIPTEMQPGAGDNAIAAVVAVLNSADISALLETDIFGDDMAYVVISDEKGNVIVDTKSKKQFGNNVLDTFATFAPEETVAALAAGLESGDRHTMDLMGVTTEFLTYYTPLMSAEDIGGESGAEFSILNWRLLILTRTDVLTENISRLFFESRMLLYSVLTLFGASLVIYILISTRQHIKELTLSCVGSNTGILHDVRFKEDANLLLRRNGPRYAMVSYNIVNFKRLNEQLGHSCGDEALGVVGHTIRDFLGENETAAHSFADRFTVFMRMDTPEGGARVHSLEQRLVAADYPGGLHLGFTIGVYYLTDEDKDVFAAIDRAHFAQDIARAKHRQAANTVIYTPEMAAQHTEEELLADMAADALKNRDFKVYYQLKRDLRRDCWTGSEALVRWDNPRLGFIYPGKFVPLFERNGFIVRLDRYVFETVCSDLRDAMDKGEKTVPVSVNISRCHFEEENFFDEYEEIMQRYAIPHELLEFEITETLAARDSERIKALIDHLHAIGCKCSLDDFGTGYSSLSMVQEFPFDVIKLDRSFFYGRDGFNRDSQLIVETLISLSHRLQKRVISEGVESRELVDFLRANACDMIQGYYYAKPVCFEDYRRRLNEAG